MNERKLPDRECKNDAITNAIVGDRRQRPRITTSRALTTYYDEVTGDDKQKHLEKIFYDDNKARTRSRQEAEREAEQYGGAGSTFSTEQTFGFITQNVNGLGATEQDRNIWFGTFGATDQHGRSDVSLLQETHVTAKEVLKHEKLFATRWGFRQGPRQQQLSFWSPSNNMKGGVAVLIDPYGSFKNATPVLQEHWTAHFMAVQGYLGGKQTVVCNVYAPHLYAEREAFYKRLQEIDLPKDALVLVGGDFNCTLDDQADRTYHHSAAGHDSPRLRELLNQWGLLDPVAIARPSHWTQEDLAIHHHETHTYHYTIPGKGEASSRLDRWYVSAETLEWVAAWNKVVVGAPADHHAVKVHLHAPDDPIRVCRPARIHPAPTFAAENVKQLTIQLLQEFQETSSRPDATAEDTAVKWEQLKCEIARRTRLCIRTRKRSLRGTLKQKLTRLLRQQQRLHEEQRGRPATVDTVTDLMDGLSLDDMTGPTRAARLRRAISDCKRAKVAVRQQQLYRDATHWTGKTTKQFFRRVSTKFGDNTIHKLDPIGGAPNRGVHDKADILADAWTPILQQVAADTQTIEEVMAWTAHAENPTSEQTATAEVITELEVRTALWACKRGKAAGPDRLGNGWHRDYEEQLVPILTVLFNLWYEAGHFPSSFLEADIFCLKKGGSQSNPLNYRPLALLNTDYKIFTRILASRVSATLADQIHPNQNGFVPGRTIHETLDLYDAAQRMAIVDPSQIAATALLLDFRKAYDSLDRAYMIKVLRRQGYPEKFIKAVWQLHSGTTVHFLANGTRSHRVQVTSGIRQGCPLAPMLFILALDPLYRKLDGFLGVRGIIVQSEAGRFELRVAGYADDTAAFVRQPADIPPLMRILRTFGKASGLQINAGKTKVIRLNPQGSSVPQPLPDDMEYQPPGEACRYVGIQVGSAVEPSYTWKVAGQQLETRLRLASQKVLTVDQRSLIASAIIIPKLLYVARHAWPTTADVNAMNARIKNYVWHGQFTKDVQGARAWLDADLAALPRTNGGLAIPDLRTELYAMAAVTVSKWAELGTTQAHIVGDVLFHNTNAGVAPTVFITPEYTPPRSGGVRRRRTLWDTGRALLTEAGAPNPADAATPLRTGCSVAAFAVGGITATWTGDTLSADCSFLITALATTDREENPLADGSLHLEWLPYAELDTLQITTMDGLRHSLSGACGGIGAPHTILRDIIRWRKVERNVIAFELNNSTVPRAPSKEQAEILVLTLLMNFPRLAIIEEYPDEVRFQAAPADHPVLVSLRGCATIEMVIQNDTAGTPRIDSVDGHLALTTHLANFLKPNIIVKTVHPHPKLSRLVCLWAGRRRWTRHRREYKARIEEAKRRRGIEKLKARQAQWAAHSPVAAQGLDELEWKRIRRVVGLGPWGEQLLLRLKLHAFSLYDIVNSRLGCPHKECIHLRDVDLYHVFWGCPAAALLRRSLLHPWRRLGLRDQDCELAIFSLSLPAIPAGVWTHAEGLVGQTLYSSQTFAETLTEMTESCWRIGVAIYLNAVWRWRIQYFDDLNNVTSGYQKVIMLSRLRQGYNTVHLYKGASAPLNYGDTVCNILTKALYVADSPLTMLANTTPAIYLLFFDGVSRGNPGPGGSGSIILRTEGDTAAFKACWIAQMSYASKSTTNNVAENMGLLTGLRACVQHGYSPVHVIGDSEIIIRQHRRRKPPKAPHLKHIYWRSRRLADQLHVIQWHHHLRSHNKMADKLANQAMDSQRSIQLRIEGTTTQLQQWAPVLQHQHGDVAYWADNKETTTRDGIVANPLGAFTGDSTELTADTGGE